MKVLLDENLPHRLRLALQGHDVATAVYMGGPASKMERYWDLWKQVGSTCL
jgi:hypothetical protein